MAFLQAQIETTLDVGLGSSLTEIHLTTTSTPGRMHLERIFFVVQWSQKIIHHVGMVEIPTICGSIGDGLSLGLITLQDFGSCLSGKTYSVRHLADVNLQTAKYRKVFLNRCCILN